MEHIEGGQERSREEYVDSFSKEIASTLGLEIITDIKPVIFDSMEDMANAFTEYTTERYDNGKTNQRPSSPPVYLKGWVPPGEKNHEIWVVRNGAVAENGEVISEERFLATIKHEIVHIYTNKLNEHKGKKERTPVWFLEGFSMYLAGQRAQELEDEISEERLRNLDRAFDSDNFRVGYKIVGQIINEYGLEYAVSLIKLDHLEDFYKEMQKLLSEMEGNNSPTTDKELSPEELVNKYGAEIAEYFEVETLSNVKFYILDSIEDIREKYKEYTGKEAPSYVKNFTPREKNQGSMYLLRPGAIDGSGKTRKESDFMASLKHELTHIYQQCFYKENNINPSVVPSWLREGEALFLADQGSLSSGEFTISVLKNLDHENVHNYAIGLRLVSEIINKYGKAKLFELVKLNDANRLYDELQRMFKWLK